jgi:hypothetical protein
LPPLLIFLQASSLIVEALKLQGEYNFLPPPPFGTAPPAGVAVATLNTPVIHPYSAEPLNAPDGIGPFDIACSIASDFGFFGLQPLGSRL